MPSGFLLIRHPVGALGLSNMSNSSFNSTPIFTAISLVGFRVPPRTCNVGDDALVRLVVLAACESDQ